MKFGWFDETEFSKFGEELPYHYRQNFFLLCVFLLNPVRERWGVTQITSGFRSPEDHQRLKEEGYNPSDTSQHRYGEAVDFICPYAPNGMGEVYNWIISELKYKGEVIWYKKRGHIHGGLPRFNLKADKFIQED